MATATEKREQLRQLMKGIDIAMFTTRGEAGFPVSRPLSTQAAEFDGRLLWFFVRRSSAKVAEIGRDPKVNVAYASKDRNVYLSVTGTAEVVDDQAKIDELWNDAMKAFFAGGRTDPDLVLLRVTVHTVEYWDGPSTLIGKAIAFVIARVRKDDSAMGDSGQLRMAPLRAPAKAAKKRSGGSDATKGTATKKQSPKKAATARKAAASKATARKAATGKSVQAITRTADGRKVAGDRAKTGGGARSRGAALKKTATRPTRKAG